jgi:hypothetical protein
MELQVDILFTKDCTDWETADELVQQALQDLGLEADFNYWLVESDRKAFEYNFIGSPTIRVNGEDLFPTKKGTPAGLRLRSYFSDEGMLGHPTYEMIVEALQERLGL